MIKNYIAECLDRISRNLCVNTTQWQNINAGLIKNPEYLHNGAVEQIKLIEPLTLEGLMIYMNKLLDRRPNDKWSMAIAKL